MKNAILLAVTVSLICVCSGCGTSRATKDKWTDRVDKWLPVGTSMTEARQIMELHGFKCVSIIDNSITFDKMLTFHEINVILSFRGGKLLLQPTTSVVVPVNM